VTAAARRAALARIGCDLVARDGGPGDRRAAQLTRRLAGAADTVVPLEHLPLVPAWARLPRAAQRRVARKTALMSMAGAVATSIDGAWLGAHAAAAGEDAVDQAIARADEAPALAPVDAEGLDARGFTLLRATLPDTLAPLLDGEPAEDWPVDTDIARHCVALATRAA
jgi:hypothetical protein